MAIAKILIILGVVLIFFLVFREIILWYFKINERIEVMRKLNITVEQTGAKIVDEIQKLNPPDAPADLETTGL